MVIDFPEGNVRNGIYKHTMTGNLYEVVGRAFNSEEEGMGNEVVIYRTYNATAKPDERTNYHTRSVANFIEPVYRGNMFAGQRFTWVSPVNKGD